MKTFLHSKTLPGNSQRGSALAVGLLFLIILTLLGMTASSGAITQELITRNTRDNVLAMQMAEAGLRAAESWIRNNNQPDVGAVVHDIGFCAKLKCVDWDEATWANYGIVADYDSSQKAPNGIAPPYYLIEIYAKKAGYGWDTSMTFFYRVYSRGTGKNPDTERVLSSIYRY